MPRYLSPILAAVLLAAHLPTARAEATAPARIMANKIHHEMHWAYHFVEFLQFSLKRLPKHKP